MSFGKVAAEATEIVPLMLLMTGLALKDQTLIWVAVSITGVLVFIAFTSWARSEDTRIHMAFSYMMAGYGARRWTFALRMTLLIASIPATFIVGIAAPTIVAICSLLLQSMIWADAQKIVRGEINDHWKQTVLFHYSKVVGEE